MTSLMNLLRLTQDAASSAKTSARVAIENMVGSKDPKFVKRVSSVSVDVVAGRISSVKNSIPKRVLDEKIALAIQKQTSAVEYDKIQTEYAQLFDDLNGSLSKDSSMDKVMLKLTDEAALLTAEAGSPLLRRNFVESINKFLTSVNDIAKGIGDHRRATERSVVASINELNMLSNQLFELNNTIVDADYSGGDVAALEDQRDDIVRRMSALADIQVVPSEKNLFVYTSSGKPLVEHRVYEFKYQSSEVIDYSATYPDNINPIWLELDNGKTIDATSEFKGGKLGALLQLRDEKYPRYQSALDSFAKKFQQSINKVHNKGVGFPPPNKLEGKTVIQSGNGGESINWAADSVVRVAIVDASGKFADSGGGVFYVDLNLNPSGAGGLSAVDIRDQINSALGHEVVTFSNSEDACGTISFAAPEGFKIAIGSVDGSPTAETEGGVGFSEYFQLNNLIDTSHDGDGRGYSNSIKIDSRIAEDPSLLALAHLNSSIDIALTGTVAQTTALAAGDGANLLSLRSLLNDPVVEFHGAGMMPPQTTSVRNWLSGYVNTMHLDAVSLSEKEEFSSNVMESLEQRKSLLSGVNEDEESAEVMMNKIFYKSIIDTSKQLMEMLNSLLSLME